MTVYSYIGLHTELSLCGVRLNLHDSKKSCMSNMSQCKSASFLALYACCMYAFKSSQIALAYGSCNFENFQNITRAHKSRNALAFIRFPILIQDEGKPEFAGESDNLEEDIKRR